MASRCARPLPSGRRPRRRAPAPRARSAPRGTCGAGRRRRRRGPRRRRAPSRPPWTRGRARARPARRGRRRARRAACGSSAQENLPVPAARPPGTSSRSAALSAVLDERLDRARRREHEHADALVQPERLQPAGELAAGQLAGDHRGEHVAGEPALRVVRDAAAQQLERDDGDGLVEHEAVELPQAAAVLDRDEPGLRRGALAVPARGRAHDGHGERRGRGARRWARSRGGRPRGRARAPRRRSPPGPRG